ncbi:hypothetical protein [Rahnella aceris]|uniref:hypothetical protein n=1 Tax=Rahnella sp. (strain Y9602) TaxID=2703885 RepID=UPI000EB5480C|nr:hypothetical protein [Rahnella aceris]MBU9867917.1 hypothetical protein [Rahnella aceris]
MTTRSDSDVRQDAGELSTREASPHQEQAAQPEAVRIELEPGQQQSNRLRPGMSTMVSVDTAQAPVSQQY